jgi:hypothetical protein
MPELNEFVAAQRVLADDWGVHELAAREYLDEVARRAPTARQKIDADLGHWDERFRAATVEEPDPHLPMREGPAGWWQYRSPRHSRRPATEELEALGIIIERPPRLPHGD